MSVPLLDIPLRPSRIYAAGLCLLYGFTLVILVAAALNTVLKLLLLAGLFGLGWHTWREWRRLSIVKRLQILPQTYRVITEREEWELTAGHQTLVTRRLIILHLRESGRSLRLPLFQDTAASEDLRRLRVWLRCKG